VPYRLRKEERERERERSRLGMETSELRSRQIVRANNYASFTLVADKKKQDFTADFNVRVLEIGKDINFILLDRDGYEKWMRWFAHRVIEKEGVFTRVPRPELKPIYEFRSNIFQKTYRLGQGVFSLVLDNSYSTITDKTVDIHVVSRWNIKAPARDLPIVNQQVIALPAEVYEVLRRANDCYVSGHLEQCSIMFRKAVDFAIRLKLIQSGFNEKDLIDKQGNELSLSKKIGLLRKHNLITQTTAKHLADIKWYGDLGAHGKVRFVLEDIKDIMEPRVRAFLTGLSLKT